ncbi:hypothetical protein CASFOL_022043 [Castilleja foliolosa]|uniref:Ribosomal protein S2 n=1 Tax=Castilleja foliolosa TaxID=1961234 RepID=A0ABD3D104_9LAMI
MVNDGVLPSITFTTTSNEWKSKISLWYKLDFLKLNELLKASNAYQKLHINDSYGGLYKPVVVEHLNLWGCLPSDFDAAILNCFFFRICRPRFIYIHLYNDVRAKRNLVEYISKLIPDETSYLEEVSIEVWDEKAKEWHCVKETSFPELRFFEQSIRFQLTWKEHLKEKSMSSMEKDIQMMLAAEVHLGTKNCNFQMERYVFKRRNDGIYIINVGKTWEKLEMAARVIVGIENPRDIIVQSASPYGQRAVLKFARYTGCHAIAGRHTPGTFTNQLQTSSFSEPRHRSSGRRGERMVLCRGDKFANTAPLTRDSL